MYTLNTIELHSELNEWCLALTMVIYTPNMIMLDIISKIMRNEEMVPMEPIKKFYPMRKDSAKEDYAVDAKALREIYSIFAPRISAVLKNYFTNGTDFSCGVAIRGGQIVILTSSEIKMWEEIYGKQSLYRPQ